MGSRTEVLDIGATNRLGWWKEGKENRPRKVTAGRVNRQPTSISSASHFRTASRVQDRLFLSRSYANTPGAMDVFKAVETYVTKMVSEPSAMKVLLLDTHTVRGDVPPIQLRKVTS